MAKTHGFGLVKKMVVGITILSLVTYGTSLLFLTVLTDYVKSFLSAGVFQVIVLAMGVCWSALFGWIAARMISKPILQLKATAESVATGDLRVQVLIPNSDDELRSLALAFDKMLTNLKQMVKNIEENSRQTGLNVQELTCASQAAAGQAEQIGITMDQIAAGAENQSGATSEMLQSFELVGQLSTEVNQRADETRQLSRQMEQTIESSVQVIDQLIQGMHGLAQSSQLSIEAVHKLEQDAKEIGDISNVVGGLAGQTNLLALNASIEAARAGEHGRGFAVVAQEVRNLADQSGQAVQNINQLINHVQHEVGQVVKQINEQVKHATRESARAKETTQTLHSISLSVQGVVQSVDHIVLLVSQQMDKTQVTLGEARKVAKIAKDTSDKSHSIASATQEQTAIMEEIAAAGHILRDHSEKLQKQIERFTL